MENLKVFQNCLKGASRKCRGSSNKFQGLKGYFKGVSIVYLRCFKEVSRKCFKEVSYCMEYIAATRTEGGLLFWEEGWGEGTLGSDVTLCS